MVPLKHMPGSSLVHWFVFLVVFGVASVQADVPAEVKKLIRVGQYQQAEKLLLGKAGEQDPAAAYQLARLYHGDLVTAPEEDSAFNYFRMAAEAGHVDSMFQLGREYEQHLRRDFAQAQHWYNKAAQAGHRRAAKAAQRLGDQAVADPVERPSELLQAAVRACDARRTREALRRSGRSLIGEDAWLHIGLDCRQPAEILRILIEAGAQLGHVDQHGNTPLHLAIAKEHAAAANLLIAKGVDTQRKNQEGWTPRMLAQRSSSADIRALFGSQPTQRATQLDYTQLAKGKRFAGWSGLHIAAWRGDIDAVTLMLSAGVDVNARDQVGKTALFRALEREQTEVALLLLEKRAAFNRAEVDLVFSLGDRQLKHALLSAASDAQDFHDIGCASVHQGDQDIPVKLNMLGWQVDKPCNGQLPLTIAAKTGRLAQVRALLDMGVSVNLLDEQNCSALCWSTRRNHVLISQLLIEAGAQNLADTQGDTPLMLAASQGDMQTVTQLLERGASVSEQSQSGSHALMLAASAGQVAIVKRLLEHSAPVDLKNNVGDTPLILAVRDNQPEVAALLLQHGASARARNDRLESARGLAADKEDQRWMELFANRGSFWTVVTRD